jgi:hypothetical protein
MIAINDQSDSPVERDDALRIFYASPRPSGMRLKSSVLKAAEKAPAGDEAVPNR